MASTMEAPVARATTFTPQRRAGRAVAAAALLLGAMLAACIMLLAICGSQLGCGGARKRVSQPGPRGQGRRPPPLGIARQPDRSDCYILKTRALLRHC